MYINQVLELFMELDRDRFQKVLNRIYKKAGYLEGDNEEYIDQSMASRGITVIYRNSQYKKKIKLIIEPRLVSDSKLSDTDRIIRKLDKRINEYFDFNYGLDDFILSGMRHVVDINVGNRESVQAYLKVFRRIGKVKGFSPVVYECFENIDSFCLEGNSNGIEFMIYDLEGLYRKQFREGGIGRKRFKELIKDSDGILRSEVRLAKTKAVRAYDGEEDIFSQIINLSEKRKDIFLEIFIRIIPFGDFYKKDKAEVIIRREIKDIRLRRRMLRLMELIPEKKSLYLAQKAMNYRNVEKVVEMFARINLSPITISKRQDIKWLKSIYEYLVKL